MARHSESKSLRNRGEEIPSPCIRNCCLDNTEICLGCYRSLAEILKWNTATDPEKKEILTQCHNRKELRGPRWGEL